MKISNNRTPTILFVDDDLWFLNGIISVLKSQYLVITAQSADKALEVLEDPSKHVDIIVTDLMMPSGKRIYDINRGRTSGIALVEYIRNEMKCRIPVICLTLCCDSGVDYRLRKLGVQEIIKKSTISPAYILAVISTYLH